MRTQITGLDKLQRDLEQASKALVSLDGELAAVRFNPDDPASVEAAVSQIEEAIDAKIAPYQGNTMVDNIAAGLKDKYRAAILERSSAARSHASMSEIDAILSQIQNTLTDLRSAEYNSYDRHIKKLSRLLHSQQLDAITRELAQNIDLQKWIEAGLSTQGGMVGSAVLTWPSEHERELGTVAQLIDRFAEKPDEALNFSYTFYHAGSNITDNLQSMTRQMITPFVRDYITYVKARTSVVGVKNQLKQAEVLSLKPSLYGIAIDLKEA